MTPLRFVLPALALVACGAAQSGPDGGTNGQACVLDQDCNEDLAMSSLAGTCVKGACTCRAGMVRTPAGKCGTKAGPD